MVKTRATLKDVAARVGVHPSTVSRVLNPATRGMVSRKIADAVSGAAEEIGYRPNPFAYSLRTNRSFTIGVVVPDLTNPVFPPIIRGIEKTLAAADYTVILANSDNDSDLEETIVNRMRDRQIDGLILATARRDDSLVTACANDGLPVVLINRTLEFVRESQNHPATVSCVLADDATGIGLAVAHLAALGHRHIVHIAGPRALSTGYRRAAGFRSAMAAHGLDCPDAAVVECDTFTEAQGVAAFMSLFGRPEDRPTAIVAGNDMLALGCYSAARELGLACPHDISITGFNDMPIVDKLDPPLTTIRIPLFDLGATAAHALLDQLTEQKGQSATRILVPTLIVRGSTGPIATGPVANA